MDINLCSCDYGLSGVTPDDAVDPGPAKRGLEARCRVALGQAEAKRFIIVFSWYLFTKVGHAERRFHNK